MSRLTDEEIRKMSFNEADAYLETHPDEAQNFAKVYAASATKQAKKAILYLCDGAVATCRKTSCYKRGDECRHTTDATHALNPEPCNFVPDEQGNLWESDPRASFETVKMAKVGGGFSGVLHNIKL